MLYNREYYRKLNDKKILHKKGKRWVTISTALLGLIGAGAFYFPVHADVTNNSVNTQHDNNLRASEPNQQMQKPRLAQNSANRVQQNPSNNALNNNYQVNHSKQSNQQNVQRPVYYPAQNRMQVPNRNSSAQHSSITPAVNPARQQIQIRLQQTIKQNAWRNIQSNAQHQTNSVHRNSIQNHGNASTNTRNQEASQANPQIAQKGINHARFNAERHIQPNVNANHNLQPQHHMNVRQNQEFNAQHPVVHATKAKSANYSNQFGMDSNHKEGLEPNLKQEPGVSNMKSSEGRPYTAQSELKSISSVAQDWDISNLSGKLSKASAKLSAEAKSPVRTSNSTNSMVTRTELNHDSSANATAKPSAGKYSLGINKSGLSKILRANAWSSTDTSLANSSASQANNVDTSSQSNSKHMLGFTPFTPDANDVSGMVSNAYSDIAEASSIADINHRFDIESYANDARELSDDINFTVSDYNTLISGADYWKNLGQSSKAASVAEALASNGLQTDYSTLSTDNDTVTMDDSMINQALNPNKTDTISFLYQGHQVGTSNVSGRIGSNADISNGQPAGFLIANDGSQIISIDGNTHQVDVLPVEDTDTIDYMYDGIMKGSTTMRGYNNSNASADGSNMPGGFRLAGDSTNTFVYDNGTHKVNIIPITLPKQSSITVDYTDQNGNKFSVPATGTSGQSGNDITTLAPVPSGYTLNAGQDTHYSFTDNPGVINLSIVGNTQNYNVSIQINKYANDGSLLGTSTATKNVSGKTGSTYVIDPNEFTPAGFESQSNDFSGQFTRSGITDNSASFNYRKENSAPITVEYMNQNHQQVGENTITGYYNQTGSVTVAPTGYNIQSGQDTNYTISASPQTMEVLVNGNSASSLPDKGLFRVIIEKQSNGKVTDDEPRMVQVNGDVGDKYTIDPNNYAPEGYVAMSQPVSGTITPSGLSVNNARFAYVNDNSNSIVVNYNNQYGQRVGGGVINGIVGNVLNVTDQADGGIPVPDGYALNNGQNVKYSVQKGVHAVDLTVTGGREQNDAFNLHIVLRRLDSNGNWTTKGMLSKNLIIPESGAVGNEFQIDPNSGSVMSQIPNGDAFEADSADNMITGTITANGLSNPNGVLYYDTRPGVQGGTVTINYMDGNKLADTEMLGGAPDEYVNVLNTVPTGYSAQNADDYTNVLVGDNPQTITIPLSENHPAPHAIIINHPASSSASATNKHNSASSTSNSTSTAASSHASSASNQTHVSSSTSQRTNSSVSSSASSSQSESASSATSMNQSTSSSVSSESTSAQSSSNSSEAINSNVTKSPVTIQYVDANNQIIKSMSVPEDNFDARFYNNIVPEGYQFVNNDDNFNANDTNPQIYQIDVAKQGTVPKPNASGNEANSNSAQLEYSNATSTSASLSVASASISAKQSSIMSTEAQEYAKSVDSNNTAINDATSSTVSSFSNHANQIIDAIGAMTISQSSSANTYNSNLANYDAEQKNPIPGDDPDRGFIIDHDDYVPDNITPDYLGFGYDEMYNGHQNRLYGNDSAFKRNYSDLREPRYTRIGGSNAHTTRYSDTRRVAQRHKRHQHDDRIYRGTSAIKHKSRNRRHTHKSIRHNDRRLNNENNFNSYVLDTTQPNYDPEGNINNRNNQDHDPEITGNPFNPNRVDPSMSDGDTTNDNRPETYRNGYSDGKAIVKRRGAKYARRRILHLEGSVSSQYLNGYEHAVK